VTLEPEAALVLASGTLDFLQLLTMNPGPRNPGQEEKVDFDNAEMQKRV